MHAAASFFWGFLGIQRAEKYTLTRGFGNPANPDHRPEKGETTRRHLIQDRPYTINKPKPGRQETDHLRPVLTRSVTVYPQQETDAVDDVKERDMEAAVVTEANLVAACVRGDRDAQRLLYEIHQAAIYRLVTRMVGAQDAADVAQQAFLQAFRNLGRFAGRSSLETWLHRVALNECWQHHRRARRVKWHVLGQEPMDASPGPERDADERELLKRALARLEPDLRAVFVLREVESRSYREMAEILNISEGTVASRLNRARRLLREYLIELGWDP